MKRASFYAYLLILLFILVCALIVGCATTSTSEKNNIEVRVWERAELDGHIGGYLEAYGDPIIFMYAQNFETGDEYMEIYWEINGYKYKVSLYKTEGKWAVMEDQIARGII